ncbi:MAG: hypothetical protein EBS01_07630 [Verrucomicrobia bacterium]|nr:hypothetical protein [Verrucomicrobiota bacterium]
MVETALISLRVQRYELFAASSPTGIGKPLTHVQSVKAHAAGIRRHLTSLADLAKKHDEWEPEIQSFFGEAFFNLFNILSECQGAMEGDRGETELEVFSQKDESGTASLAVAI